LYCDFGSSPSSKILGFDVDSTLITTKSGKTFAVNEDDWRLLYDNIPAKVQAKAAEGFRVVIFTNQGGVSKGHVSLSGIQGKLSRIVEALGMPVLVMAALGTDEFRKPCTGMWDFLKTELSQGTDIDIAASLYVGDAAGRPAKGSRKKDFSDTDLKYALNIGAPFNTPEQFFLDQPEVVPTPAFDPRTLLRSGSLFKNSSKAKACADTQEMIVFIGAPASGKSTFWKTHLAEYVRVNNDTLKSKDKCIRAAQQALASGKSCVIDNTNPTREVRNTYIAIARTADVPVRAFDFASEKSLSFHLDTLREVNSFRSHLSKRVGSMPIHTFFKNYEAPKLEEGFSEVLQVNLVGGPFDNEEDERLFYSFVYS
jgi:bifunctional polynucleotide phosphatase/kinase